MLRRLRSRLLAAPIHKEVADFHQIPELQKMMHDVSRRLTLLRSGDRAAEACEGAEDGDAANASGAAAAGGVSAGCRLAGLGRSCDCSARWACVARGVAETRVAGAAVRLLARGREVVGVSCDGAAGARIAFLAVGVVTADEADEEEEEEEVEQEEGRPL